MSRIAYDVEVMYGKRTSLENKWQNDDVHTSAAIPAGQDLQAQSSEGQARRFSTAAESSSRARAQTHLSPQDQVDLLNSSIAHGGRDSIGSTTSGNPGMDKRSVEQSVMPSCTTESGSGRADRGADHDVDRALGAGLATESRATSTGSSDMTLPQPPPPPRQR